MNRKLARDVRQTLWEIEILEQLDKGRDWEEKMARRWIVKLGSPAATLETVGGKGASLARLFRKGFAVPAGFVVTTDAYRQFVAENGLQPEIYRALASIDEVQPESLEQAASVIQAGFMTGDIPPEIAAEISQGYAMLPGDQPSVAVRSSATAEDLPEASFAGQQRSYLNVQGESDLLEKVRRCWASLWTTRAIAYRAHQGIDPAGIALAVVVQRLVSADVAGVMFTANPINGRRDQVVISASWGLGEAVVSGLVTADSLTLDRSNFKVVARQIGDKERQVVSAPGGTAESLVPEERRWAAALTDYQAADLARLGEDIERLFGQPMDIEWALEKEQFAILQARPITAMAEPLPAEWRLPEGAYVAMRNNIVELMAEPLSPLFGTFGLQAVNASMTRLMTAFFGEPGYLPEEPILRVNGYAYYNGSIPLGKIMKILLNSVGIFRRMMTGAVERWTENGWPRYRAVVSDWEAGSWQEYPSSEILAGVRELTEAAIDAYGALVSGVIPAAWISEGLFTLHYNLYWRKGDPPAPVFLMGFDSLPIKAEKSLYDLACWTRARAGLASSFQAMTAGALAACFLDNDPPPDIEATAWFAWRSRFQAHLDTYGHMIYNLDFANPVPADDPVPVLDTFLMFLAGEGDDPHARQQRACSRREEEIRRLKDRLNGWRWRGLWRSLSRAQKYAPLREDGLADVGLSYPLARRMLLELGRRFTESKLISGPEEIFWMENDEVEAAVIGVAFRDDLSEKIARRKRILRAAQQVAAPRMLPQIRLFGYDLDALKAIFRRGKANTLKGVAASPGTMTAPARVIRGPQEFGALRQGDILVASITTPAWTPLFARASAIVTDVGGPLSHGSIVAREYGIPAVLGTGSATKIIRSGQMVTVVGHKGMVRFANHDG